MTLAAVSALPPNGQVQPVPIIKPAIVVNGTTLSEQLELAQQGLKLGNTPPRLFARDDGLVRVDDGNDGQQRLQVLDVDRLRTELDAACEWVKVDKKGNAAPVYPPQELLRSLRTLDHWPALPYLRQLVTCPTLTGTGRLVATPGYDFATGLYLALDPTLVLEPIPEHPTQADARAAMEVIEGYLQDFPFSSAADHDNALAYLFALVMRSLRPPIGADASTPLFLVDSPTAGTGKGTLIDLGAVIASGLPAPVQTVGGRDAAEWRKGITTSVMAQAPVNHLDNAASIIADASLCSVLTARGKWNDRLLGTNLGANTPVVTIFALSGNNVRIAGDMLRRVVWIRLDSGIERPELRDPETFMHPDVLGDALRERGRLLSKMMTIGLAWMEAGRPRPSAPLLGSFVAFCHQIFGMLEFAGATHGLENHQHFRAQQDEEHLEWSAFLDAWYALLAEREVSCRELAEIYLDKTLPSWFPQLPSVAATAFRESLPSRLQPATETEKVRLSQKLGYALKAHQDRIFGKLRLVRAVAGPAHHGVALWQVTPLPTSSPASAHTRSGKTSPPSQPSPPVEKSEPLQVVAIAADSGGDRTPIATAAEEKPFSAGCDGGDSGEVFDAERVENRVSVVEVVREQFPTPEYVLVRSTGELEQHLPRLLAEGWLGLDTETTGLDATSDRLCLVQLAPKGEGPVVVVDALALDPRVLEPIFRPDGPVLIGHNIAFDLRFLGARGLPCPPPRHLFDTELVARLLGASGEQPAPGTYALDSLVRRELGLELRKEQQRSDFSARPLSAEQLNYAVADAAAVMALTPQLSEQVRTAGLRRVARLEMDVVPFMTWLDASGVALDADIWNELAHAAIREQYELELRLTELAGTGGLAGEAGDFRFGTVNWSAWQQVLKVLQQRGLDPRDDKGKPSTDSRILAGLLEDDPLVAVLLDHRDAAKRASSYGSDWLARYLRQDSRLHPDWHQLGAVIGRMTCREPIVQGVPRGPRYRRAFRAPEGRVLVKADYSQIDLRVAAEWAPDETLIRAYQDGVDVHRLTASRVRGVPAEDVGKEDRQAAKSTNFGTLYGMGVPRFIEQARAENGVTFTRAEAQAFRNGFFGLYRGIKAWHDRFREPYGTETPIDITVRSGRRRTAVKRFTEKLASPVQMQVSDGFKTALGNLWRTRDQVPSAKPVLVVHDEVVLEVDEHDAQTASEWLRTEMVAGMQHVLERVPVVVETTIARDWAGTPLEEVGG